MNKIESSTLYTGHKGAVNALSWSPDSQFVASASNDTTVQIWHARHSSPIVTYKQHTEPVEAVAWSPSGEYIASAGWGKTIHVWHAQTGETHFIYHGHQAWIRKALAWSPNSLFVASGSWDRKIHLWQALNGEVEMIYQGHQSIVTSLSWSPDSMYIASGGGCPHPEIHFWKASTGEMVSSYQQYRYSIRGIAWSPDSKTAVAISLQEAMRRIHAETGEEIMEYGYTEEQNKDVHGNNRADTTYGIDTITWSPTTHYLATSANGTALALWNAETGENIASAHAPTEAIAWSPDGTMLASANNLNNTVLIWQLR